MGPDGDIMMLKLGTVKAQQNYIYQSHNVSSTTYQLHLNVTLSVAITGDIVLTITSHIRVLPSSKVLNCGMV